jgi:hypothetical protein
MRKSSIGLLLTLAAVFPAAARAGGVEVTPFLGYRLSVDFKDVGTDSSRLDESATYGLMIDIPLNDRTRLELLVDLQETDLVKSEVFGDPELFPVDVSYFQVGATREWETRKTETRSLRPFVVGTVGIAEFNPQGGGLRTGDLKGETRVAFTFGGGAKLFFHRRVGVRLDGRVFAAYFEDAGGLFCGSAGCFARVSGSLLWQAEVSAGLILKF